MANIIFCIVLLYILLLPVFNLVSADEICKADIYPELTVVNRLSCEDRIQVSEWLGHAMYPPDEKETHIDKWYPFLVERSDLASEIIREYVNYNNYDGAGNYEKWGILWGLPEKVRIETIERSFKLFTKGSIEPFTSFADCWGHLLLLTPGLDAIVNDLDQYSYHEKYNAAILKIAIRNNYGKNIDLKHLSDSLMALYHNEYKYEEGWYEPEHMSRQVNVFIKKLNRQKILEPGDLPLVFIP